MKDLDSTAAIPFAGEDIRICVIGLGYVGLPLARLFSTKYPVVGFDINRSRVETLNSGHDTSHEVSDELLQEALNKGRLVCTANINDIKDSNFYVIAVPTPVDNNKNPDLTPLYEASKIVGKVIKKGDVVVYESTVYPGVTEEVCIPAIEEESGFCLNKDFYAGYSPERINPGDKIHTIEKIKKITSGSTPEITEIIDKIYNSVLVNGTYKASSIKVAEAAKVVENAQRDINIAFFNELSMIFNAMGIDTQAVIEAASSKWNFVKLKPGLVGGHCISIDPYYLINKASKLGVSTILMNSARNINEGMGAFVVKRVLDLMNRRGVMVKDAKVLILGFTFKENCPDIRNTKVLSIINALKEYTDDITVYDPWPEKEKVESEYGIHLSTNTLDELEGKFDAVILAVAHKELIDKDLRKLLKDPSKGVLYDVKSVLPAGMAHGKL